MRLVKTAAVLLLCCCGLAALCQIHEEKQEPTENTSQNEIVMTPGMSITAKTSVGTITITAGKGLERSYTWEGETRSVEMLARDKRWYGSLGLYYPGPGDHWKEHSGITRGVVEEGQQHFASEEEALKWIRARNWMPFVYTHSGLVVGWGKVLNRRQLNVEVWQIYIKGKKPVQLEGSQDDKIVAQSQKPAARKTRGKP